MQPHERNLFISLCLGIEWSEEESAEDLEGLVADTMQASAAQSPVSLQHEVARWLQLSLEDCESRKAASVKLWDRVQNRGFTIIDVPAPIRRTAFAGNLNPQKREYRKGWLGRLTDSVRALAIRLIVIVGLVAALWFAAKKFLP